MIVFISGPITGMPGYNKELFDKAEAMLCCAGHTVLNPTKLIPQIQPEAIPHKGYMRICLAMFGECDAIYMLNGWQDSKGAKIELAKALTQGKVILSDLSAQYTNGEAEHE